MIKLDEKITHNMYLRADLAALGLLVHLASNAKMIENKLVAKIAGAEFAKHTQYTIGQLRGTLARLEIWGMIKILRKGKKREAFLIEILRYFSAE